jgi:hypothetical protein
MLINILATCDHSMSERPDYSKGANGAPSALAPRTLADVLIFSLVRSLTGCGATRYLDL